ncbi:MAG: amino acid permease [Clostridia bacterium]|nr:amino acid permease [Clostridia bacterium]
MVRALGLREAITITVGTVVGVGLFTVGANAIGWMGPAIILATLVAFLVSVYPALMYAEMGAALPFAGGTYNFATEGLGKLWGTLAGWNFVISLVAVATGESLAFSNYFKWMMEGLGVPLAIDERIIAGALLVIFTLINWRGIKLAGVWQNIFVFFFWGAATVWFIIMIPNLLTENFRPLVPLPGTGWREFILATSLVWWCFAGFETAVAMGEEISFPKINIPRAMFLAPLIVFVVNAFFQWFLVAIMPKGELTALQEASAPYAEGMRMAGIAGIPFVLLCLAIAFGGDLSTINPSIGAPARYLFGMARDGVLPPVFGRLHPRYKTPDFAIWFLGLAMLLLVSTGSIIYVASVSLFADLAYYIIGFVAAIGLRLKRPDLPRPYKAPALIPGAIISIIIYLIMMTQLPREGIWTGLIWLALGIIFYLVWTNTPAGRAAIKLSSSGPMKTSEGLPDPTPEERKRMDREYRLWWAVFGCLFVAVVALYAIPALIK